MTDISLSPFELYRHADVIVKSVIIIMVFSSFMTWFIWVGKMIEVYLEKKSLKKFNEYIREAILLKDVRITGAGYCFKAISVAKHELGIAETITPGARNHESIKERAMSKLMQMELLQIRKISGMTSILATTSAVSPFIGLFGTVWGIMHSFVSIAQTQTTNLSVVAPGIAEALFATALGLLVAVPAVILYNILGRMINGYRIILNNVAATVMCLLSQQLDVMAYEPHASGGNNNGLLHPEASV